MPRFAAHFFKERYIGDPHAAINRFAHVVDRK